MEIADADIVHEDVQTPVPADSGLDSRCRAAGLGEVNLDRGRRVGEPRDLAPRCPTTSAPSAARALHTACPIPLLAPLTNTA